MMAAKVRGKTILGVVTFATWNLDHPPVRLGAFLYGIPDHGKARCLPDRCCYLIFGLSIYRPGVSGTAGSS